MIRCGQKTIIFLINNGGYTIEVEIHDGPYNVIKNWNYTGLVDAIHNGEGNCWTAKVSSIKVPWNVVTIVTTLSFQLANSGEKKKQVMPVFCVGDLWAGACGRNRDSYRGEEGLLVLHRSDRPQGRHQQRVIGMGFSGVCSQQPPAESTIEWVSWDSKVHEIVPLP